MSDNNVADTWAKEFGMRPSVENTKYLMEILATTKNPQQLNNDIQNMVTAVEKAARARPSNNR